MLPTMAEPEEKTDRVRYIFDTEEIVRRAIQLRANKLGVRYRRKVSGAEAVNEILREALAEEIAELRANGGTEPPPNPSKKRGRPKSS